MGWFCPKVQTLSSLFYIILDGKVYPFMSSIAPFTRDTAFAGQEKTRVHLPRANKYFSWTNEISLSSLITDTVIQ